MIFIAFVCVTAQPLLSIKSFECGLCETTFTLTKHFMQQNDSYIDIDLQVCDLYPSSMQPMCLQIFSSFHPVYVEALNRGMSSDKVCSEMYMCEGKRTIAVQLTKPNLRGHK